VGQGVHYGSATDAAPTYAGGHVIVVGGANSAGQAALHLATHAKHVTMLVRGESLARAMSR
jgi:thioredoxin reductase (NADPH)